MQTPCVRHFIACEELLWTGTNVSLHIIIFALRPRSLPRLFPQIDLFMQLSDGLGKVQFVLDFVLLDDPLDEKGKLLAGGTFILDMGNNRLGVFGHSRRFRNLLIETPGHYEFRLACEGIVLAREPIRVEVKQ